MPESWYLKRALGIRYRRWSEIQLESFVMDCKDIEDLIEKIIFQEKHRII